MKTIYVEVHELKWLYTIEVATCEYVLMRLNKPVTDGHFATVAYVDKGRIQYDFFGYDWQYKQSPNWVEIKTKS